MIGFLIQFLVIGLVLYLVYWLIGHFGAPSTVQQIVGIICILILLLLLLGQFVGTGPGGRFIWQPGTTVIVP